MRYIAYVLMFAMVIAPSLSFAQDQDLESLMKQLQAGDTTTGSTTTGSTTATTTTTDPVHGAPEIKIQNTSYTYKGNEYTITWTPIQGTSKVEVSVKNADTDMDYTKVDTVLGSAGSVKINLTSQGTYMIKLTPVDDFPTPLGPDQIMTIKVEAPAVAPTTPTKEQAKETVKAAPQVGPAQDLLFGALILIAILYFVYRFRSND